MFLLGLYFLVFQFRSVQNIVPFPKSVPPAVDAGNSHTIKLDMKLVARDVKTIFCFSWVCVVMVSGLFLLLLCFAK
jgi:hypothetical protein